MIMNDKGDFIMINNKTIEQARNADIITFFEQNYGFKFAYRNGAYRCQQHPSLAVKDNRLSWYWHSKSIGGFGTLDYLVKVENMPFRDAVEAVAGIKTINAPIQQETENPKTLILPKRAGNPLLLYDYLCCKRNIYRDIVLTLIQEGTIYGDKRGNVIFVGYDENGQARFASMRGTSGDFRGDCAGSDKRYGFTMAYSLSERVYIFESPIDAMSHASLENIITGDNGAWVYHNRLSLSGTSDTAIPFFLNQHPHAKELIFCLDNDTTGREAAVNMARKYTDMGYRTRLELPKNKDFNEDLKAYTTSKPLLQFKDKPCI
jgi:hypothetical protein